MISSIWPLQAGNALRLFLTPPSGATSWKILRKGSDSFTGVDDADAVTVFVGTSKKLVDAENLLNEVMAFYKPYYRVAGAWVEGATASGTPVATYEDHSTDAVAILRDRLERGLQVEVERGTFATDLGYIQVFTAPPSLEHGVRFPLVTVQLEHEGPGERGIGEDPQGPEYLDEADSWLISEGWLASVQINVTGWTLNSDERIELRKALRRLVLANLSTFDSLGLQQISFSQSDFDAVNGEFNAPLYQTVGTFTCLAPTRVVSTFGSVTEVTTEINTP